MFEFLEKLFQRKPETACIEGYDDEFGAACALEAFRTGNIIIGCRNEDGSITMTEVPREK